jgi:PmbA protein
MEKLKEIVEKRIKDKNFYGDIYVENVVKTEVIVNESKVEKLTKSDTICGNVRIFKNGKMGFCYFSGNDADIIDKAVTKAKNSVFIEGYEKYFFTGNKNSKKVNVFDPSYINLNDDERINKALLLEKSVKENSFIKMARDSNYSDFLEKTFYMNSENVSYYNEKTKFFILTSAVAEKNGSRELAEIFEITTLLNEIDVERTGKECAEKAQNLLDGKQIKSGKYKIMFPPETACDIISLISRIFLGNNVVKGKSLLSTCKPGDTIGSKTLNIRDDALMDFKTGSFSVDAEGEPGNNKFVVENGILKTFLTDKLNAVLQNTNTTGNSTRTDFRLLPDCGVSNFYVVNGDEQKEKVMKNFSGIYVNSLMGLHMADTVSGNFSLAFNGVVIENGEKAGAIKESLITGNLRDLLNKIIITCNDLKFYVNYGSPTIVMDDMEVTGA